MRGSFQMAVLDPARPTGAWLRTFDAEVATFRFIPPRSSSGDSGGGGSSGSS